MFGALAGRRRMRGTRAVDRFLHRPVGGAARRLGREGQNLLRLRRTRKQRARSGGRCDERGAAEQEIAALDALAAMRGFVLAVSDRIDRCS